MSPTSWKHGAYAEDAPGGTLVLDPPRRGSRRARPRDPVPPGEPPDDSWGGDGGRGDGFGDGPSPDGAPRFALFLALIGSTTLFLVFLATWLLLRRDEPDPMRASPLVPPRALWLGTLLIAASSATLERAVRSRVRARSWLSLSLALGVTFVAVQVWLGTTLALAGLVPASGAYAATFFALTGLHALHVLGGLLWMTLRRLALRPAGGRPVSLRLCALYWHFMGVVWLLILASLTLLR